MISKKLRMNSGALYVAMTFHYFYFDTILNKDIYNL